MPGAGQGQPVGGNVPQTPPTPTPTPTQPEPTPEEPVTPTIPEPTTPEPVVPPTDNTPGQTTG
jgi:hypothetical protein